MTDAAGTITVRLSAGLKSRTPARRTTRSVDAVEAPGLAPGAARLAVSGLHAARGQPIGAGDGVELFPPLGGG